jgi:hypothetical protein
MYVLHHQYRGGSRLTRTIRASMTPLTRNSLSQNTPESATPSQPTDSTSQHTIALLPTVRLPHTVPPIQRQASKEEAQFANNPLAQIPKCPKGIMQWQHGSYEKLANGSLILKPIKVDGRQLYSDPCQYKNAVYTRYNASERFKVCFSPLSQHAIYLVLTPSLCSNIKSPSTDTTRSSVSISTKPTARP